MNKVKNMIEKYDIPGRDLYSLPTSKKTFGDKTNYRIEISGVERLSTLEALVDEKRSRGIPVHRIIATVMGSTYLDDDELKKFSSLAKKENIEVIMTPGPRTSWDIGRQISTSEGVLSGIRVRGSDNLNFLIQDILRCIDFGIRGFLVTDEGVMWLLNKMRQNGDIPKDTKFKLSIFTGHGNGAGAKLVESIGADSFNPLGDLTLPMIASIRSSIEIPLDIHVMLSDSFGGINRIYETPEIVRLASPCYLKLEPGQTLCIQGGIYKPWTDEKFLQKFTRDKVKYAEMIIDIIEKENNGLTMSEQDSKDLFAPI